MTRVACVDIGSNTTRLLVAEADPARPGGLRVLRAERAFLRLTAEDRANGPPEAKCAALEDVVRAQVASARAMDVAALRVVGTAALRGCPDLGERLAAAAGAPVEVLAEAEEARLAFLGATAGLPQDDRPVAVVDVGGGSTEVAIGAPGGAVTWWTSLPVGSGVLTDAHLRADPPTEQQLDAARAVADAALAVTGCPGAERAWAVGGSATSLRRFVGEDLTPGALDRALRLLATTPSRLAAGRLDLAQERARLLPAGLLLLGAVSRALGCPLRVGGGGMREGLALDLLAQVG